MSYTGTKGQTGNGTVLAIYNGTTYITVGEAVEITPSGYENKVDEATNLQSTGVERVFTITDGGTWDFSANRVSTDAGQLLMAAAYASGAATLFKVTLPKETGQTTAGDSFGFSAILTKFMPAIKVDKVTKISGALATTNGVTLTEGS